MQGKGREGRTRDEETIYGTLTLAACNPALYGCAPFGLAVLGARCRQPLTTQGKWGYLWHEWFTSST